jgi:flavin reductase (DIM6/NTAB) family NADH-FMN oxidoreductase RutF
MDEQAKKSALLMIPYGLYVLGTKAGDEINVATVNWVTQTSFKPPLVAVGVKKDTRTYEMLAESKVFSLSFLESGQKDLAFAFFRPVTPEDGKIGGYAYETAETGAPIISDAPAWVEGRVAGVVDVGDHATVVCEVTNAGLKRESKVLTLEECGVKYGG